MVWTTVKHDKELYTKKIFELKQKIAENKSNKMKIWQKFCTPKSPNSKTTTSKLPSNNNSETSTIDQLQVPAENTPNNDNEPKCSVPKPVSNEAPAPKN